MIDAIIFVTAVSPRIHELLSWSTSHTFENSCCIVGRVYKRAVDKNVDRIRISVIGCDLNSEKEVCACDYLRHYSNYVESYVRGAHFILDA
jgi:hypothetical protein